MSNSDFYEIIITDYATHAEAIRAVRDQVFLVEQQIAPEEEIDDRDDLCIHALAVLHRLSPTRTSSSPLEPNAAPSHAGNESPIFENGSGCSKPVGTGRVDLEKDGKVGRLAVLKDFRRRGIGKQLMQAFEGYALDHELPRLWFHAQRSAVPFYLALGYQIVSEEFEEAGIPHVVMEKQFS